MHPPAGYRRPRGSGDGYGCTSIGYSHEPSRDPTKKGERIVGIVILAILVVITAVIFHVQGRLSPALFSMSTQRSNRPASPLSADSDPQSSIMPRPEEMEAIGPLEVFTSATLSDKINGKAELYFSAGFIRLESRRFSPAGDPDLWAEFFAYDMGNSRNAYSVFSAQRREGAATSTVASDAYKTANALFFVHGKYYVEILGAFELFFTQGPFFAGIHESEKMAPAIIISVYGGKPGGRCGPF